MSKTQFFLFAFSSIPVIGVMVMSLLKQYPSLLRKINVILPIIFLVNYFNLLGSYINSDKNSLIFFSISRDVAIGLAIEPISLIFLAILSFCWLAISCYANRYYFLNNDNKIFQFQLYLAICVEFIALIMISKNLISVFIFYQSLIFSLYFFGTYFMHKQDIKAAYNLTFIELLSSFTFLLAIIFTYKMTGQIDFSASGVISGNLPLINYLILVSLYFIGFALMAVLPLYLLYGNLYYLNPIGIILVFVLSYGMIICLILFKIISYIIGLEVFVAYNQSGILDILILLMAINLAISAVLSFLGDNLKKMLIYLFFNQLIFAILSIFILNTSAYKATITIAAFILGQIITFFTIGNINIYLAESKQKTINGAFYKLKITSSFLIFALLSNIGFAPSIGLTSKYLLIKQAIIDQKWIYLILIFLNMVLNSVCMVKIIRTLFKKDEENPIILEAANKVEFNFGLMLPLIIIAAIMFLGFLFPSFIINFSKNIF